MKKGVYCDYCKREIKIRPDLVTATVLGEVVPYHEDCFAKNLKGMRSFFVSNQPINGTASIVTIIFLGIVTLFGLLIRQTFGYGAAILFVISLIYRSYSYLKFERRLEK
ncbi:hypothetical protein [Paenisporosarcina cavernae]|uniref:Permease n=1 Tax=Paenisporosarcina cavernae TaxID=2320858 RepID=A0A385YT39_9BACL|nr:hypothetical protein [Paenisporosarcina cavernae]AYC28623.1 hypothetical protein D3873_01585 [Paenisporosarcina cavernae]